MSSREYPRLISASTAASAAARVLKKPVIKVFDIVLLLRYLDQLAAMSLSAGENRLARSSWSRVKFRGIDCYRGGEVILRQRCAGCQPRLSRADCIEKF